MALMSVVEKKTFLVKRRDDWGEACTRNIKRNPYGLITQGATKRKHVEESFIISSMPIS